MENRTGESVIDAGAVRPAANPRLGIGPLLWALMLVYALNTVDRHLMSVLAQYVGRDLALSDTQLGLVAGIGFSAVYVMFALPWGWLADRPRVSRVWVISGALAIWSAMTAVCGLAQNIAHLLIGRMGVAAGEAGCAPASQALIADSVPPARLARALAIFGLGLPLGILVGRSLGGLLADQFGWRATFLIVGLPGIAFALILGLVFRDVGRHVQASLRTAAKGTVALAFRKIFVSRAIVSIMLGNVTMGGLLAGMGFWGMVHFQRNLGLSAGQAGLALGVLGGITGIAGTLIGGWVADKLATRRPRHYLTPGSLSTALAPPLFLLAYWSDNWWIATLLLVLPNMCDNLCYAGAAAATQRILTPDVRATATSLIQSAVMLAGPGLGVTLFGVASDAVQRHLPASVPETESIRYVLMGASLGFVVPAILYWLGGRAAERELAQATP